MLFSLFYNFHSNGTSFGQLWPNNGLGSWRVAISKGCACSSRMIDAWTELYWKWRGNPSGSIFGALPSHCWKTEQNHCKTQFAVLQTLAISTWSMYSLKLQRNFVQIVSVAINHEAFWNWTPLDCSLWIQNGDGQGYSRFFPIFELRRRLKLHTLCPRYLIYRIAVQF